ncbi:MAG: adenosylmethionine--8-amino-7-oxononanoate transaminase [Rickettsiales bacterium]|jgi:adenosylmethionine-8-amino-7-oxononanoate aminotransferase|nr:adenosylmethionine--8-amino-7-oxononanoate transaminase [Rickettsiales bacterium]
MDYVAFDQKYIWHPFTQEATAQLNINIARGDGVYLYDNNGKEYVDLISSWWVNCHGHCNKKIAEAICRQTNELEHVIFANFTHSPAIKLVSKLRNFLDPRLSNFFFSDNGSTAVEIALKMTFQYWQNKGDNNRILFVGLDGNYHGDTVGAMSLGKSSGFYDPFGKLLFEVKYIPYPDTWIGDKDIGDKEGKALEFTENFLNQENEKISAFCLEPIVQGSSGMRMARADFISKICKQFQKYNIPVIFDEVMTGFGRTGAMFSYQQTDVIPDILCLSKALTGGFMPLALTITTDSIHREFYSPDGHKTFLHGHSYTANPIACAAAIASLEIFEENDVLGKIRKIEQVHQEELKNLEKYDFLEKFRVSGLISAFEIKNIGGYGSDFSNTLKHKFFEAGLLLRPLGNVIYFLPPYIIDEDLLRICYGKVLDIIKNTV